MLQVIREQLVRIINDIDAGNSNADEEELMQMTPAYLSGDSAMALAETICEFGCSHCRE